MRTAGTPLISVLICKMLCSFRSVHVCNKSVLSVVTKRGMSNAKYQWNNFGVKLKKHPTTNNEDQNKKEMLDSFIRVDHAGEVGAKKIYEGQLAALKGNFVQPIIQVFSSSSDLRMTHRRIWLMQKLNT